MAGARNSKVSIVIVSIFCVLFLVMSLIGGIQDQTAPTAPIETAGKGDVIEYDAYFAKEVYEITHKLFALIPVRTEHFYLTLDKDGLTPYLVQAEPKWFNENFNSSDGSAKAPVHIKALLRRTAPKSGLRVYEVNRQLAELEMSVSEGLYADSNYKLTGKLKIVAGLLVLAIAVLIIWLIILFKMRVLNKVSGNALVVGLIVLSMALVVILVGYID